jgi:predicted O-methyltransferase YrrM
MNVLPSRRRSDDVSGSGRRSMPHRRPELIAAVIERVCRERTIVARSDGSTHDVFPVAVTPAEGEALRAWVQRECASRTIEVGLGYGISALFASDGLIANGDADARHVAVDPHQLTRFAGCGLQLLDEAGLRDLLEFHAEESQIALPRFVAEGRTFDLAFVDGNHRFDGVFLDLIYLGRLVRPGGIVFLDDYQLPAVAHATSFCTSNLDWRLEETAADDDFHRWAVLRTPRTPPARSFDHYVDF